jgi:phosphate/sulfate permease
MVQWSLGRQMVESWLLTIPATALISGFIFIVLKGSLNL